jgi:hypothetical protein
MTFLYFRNTISGLPGGHLCAAQFRRLNWLKALRQSKKEFLQYYLEEVFKG